MRVLFIILYLTAFIYILTIRNDIFIAILGSASLLIYLYIRFKKKVLNFQQKIFLGIQISILFALIFTVYLCDDFFKEIKIICALLIPFFGLTLFSKITEEN